METMEWKELQKMLEEHYAPAAASLAHQLNFYRRQQKPGPPGKSQRPPWFAGCKGNNPKAVCKFRDAICLRCERRGHIAEACRASLLAYPNQRQPFFTNQPGVQQQRGFQRKPNSNYKWEENKTERDRDYEQTIIRMLFKSCDLADISNHRKKSYFLSFCGAAVFDTTTALLAPQSVKEVSWEALQEILSNHYAPKPSKIARRLVFRRQTQAEGETISTYMAALRTAALQCGFKELDDMLLDQLVYG
ncbi:hypothetical protein E2320_002301 [Naja naja]|nr:hypothetical protein E2320_002301 [Naja naja]